MPEVISCYAGHLYLIDWPPPRPIKPNPERNGHIHTECKKTLNVVSLAAESETCRTLNNGKTYIDVQPSLIALYHKQPATPLKTDNYMTEGFVNLGIKPKRSKYGI